MTKGVFYVIQDRDTGKCVPAIKDGSTAWMPGVWVNKHNIPPKIFSKKVIAETWITNWQKGENIGTGYRHDPARKNIKLEVIPASIFKHTEREF